MDRRRVRRFVPSGEGFGLESRCYLSALPMAPAAQTASATAGSARGKAATPNPTESAIQQRLQRIDRLPFFMRSLQVGRFVPEAPLSQIQNQLRGMLGQLKPPSQAANQAFIKQLRSILSRPSISASDVTVLNRQFASLLTSMGAPSDRIDILVSSMTEIARNDAASSNPVFLVANDYSLVMQTILATGKPLPGVRPGNR